MFLPIVLCNEMKNSVKTLKKNKKHIENNFKSPYSNGTVEGTITKIKVIKRTAYGYTSFLNYNYRTLISFQEKEKTI